MEEHAAEKTSSAEHASAFVNPVRQRSFSSLIGSKQSTQDAPRTLRWLSPPYLQSYVCFSLYISIGFALGGTGTLLPLIAIHTNSTLAEAGALFTARGLGWIGGSVLAGALPIFELGFLPPHRLMSVCGLLLVVYFLLLPVLTNLYLLLLASVIAGLLWSWTDVRSNALLFEVWGEKVGPWMQAYAILRLRSLLLTELHFIWGVGASIAPAVIAAVLRFCAPEHHLLFSALSLAFLSLTTCILPALVPPLPTDPAKRRAEAHQKLQPVISVQRKVILIVTMHVILVLPHRTLTVTRRAAFLFVYVGIESAYGGWIYVYTLENYPLVPEWEAAFLSSVFWMATTVGRLLAIPLSIYLSHSSLLLGDLVLSLPVGLVLLLAYSFPVLQHKFVLWITTVFYGVTMASVYACVFSLPSELGGIEITHSTTSWFIVGSIGGDMAVPALMGLVIVRSSVALAWAVLLSSFILLVLFGGLLLQLRKTDRSSESELEELTSTNSATTVAA